MSATTITTIEDLVRLLDAKPEWLEALRARLLTRELLALPQQLAEFVATTNRRFEEIDRRFQAVDRRLDQLTRDIAPIKAAHARNAALRETDLMAEQCGQTFIRTLADAEISALVRSADTSDLPFNELRSFRRADLIAETRDRSGESCYLAAEISFTTNGRDTRRAMRNAELLERFTGRRAHPVVAGIRCDDRIQGCIAAGDVAWYQLDPHALEVD